MSDPINSALLLITSIFTTATIAVTGEYVFKRIVRRFNTSYGGNASPSIYLDAIAALAPVLGIAIAAVNGWDVTYALLASPIICLAAWVVVTAFAVSSILLGRKDKPEQ